MKTLALINETKDIKEVLREAIKYNDAVLEVLFVHEEELFDLPDLFRPEFEQDENIDKNAIKKEILSTLNELNYKDEAAIFVYINDTYSRVETIIKDNKTLIVTKYNSATKELADTKHKILFLRNSKHNYQKVLVELALDGDDKQRIDFAKELFPNANLTLVYDYNHFVSVDMVTIDPMMGISNDPYLDEELKEENKKSFNRIVEDSGLNGIFLEDVGEAESLIEYINNEADLAIINERDSDIMDKVVKDCLVS